MLAVISWAEWRRTTVSMPEIMATVNSLDRFFAMSATVCVDSPDFSFEAR